MFVLLLRFMIPGKQEEYDEYSSKDQEYIPIFL